MTQFNLDRTGKGSIPLLLGTARYGVGIELNQSPIKVNPEINVRTIDDLLPVVDKGEFLLPIQFLTRIRLMADYGVEAAKEFIQTLYKKTVITGNLLVKDPFGAGRSYLSPTLIQRLERSPKFRRLSQGDFPPEIFLTLVSKDSDGKYDSVHFSSFYYSIALDPETDRMLTKKETRTFARRFYTMLLGTPHAVYPQRHGLIWAKNQNRVYTPYTDSPIKQVSFETKVAGSPSGDMYPYQIHVQGMNKSQTLPVNAGFSVKITYKRVFKGPSSKVARNKRRNLAL
jgi:hypothetical protein